ncbi:MAG: hypothetical protein BroJett031_34700 [Betaproteobacteria bacterium]|nr:MAG: hypothetical protein BroJett031_34700 [Betaproteobacteria bacterium]
MPLDTSPDTSSPAASSSTDRKLLAWLRLPRPGAYAAIVVLALLGAFGYKLRFDGIFACPAGGYAGNSYLADCAAGGYGDYDHGALWFGLEPEALRAAAEADVLFVGSSRLQLALSNGTTSRWFAEPATRYFLFGLSHSENTVFVQPLLERLRPRAKAYVINVDRFFDDRVSPPMEHIQRDGDALSRYKEKRFWQGLHGPLCSALPALCGQRFAVYRSRTDGAWRTAGGTPADGKAVTDGPAADAERWPHYVKLAEVFLAKLPVDRKCVVLTIVPSVDTRRAEAEAIARALGLELIAPHLDGLTTFDGSHLDAASAARWSAAFFEAAGSRLRACLAA